MKPRIAVITVGVDDLDRSVRFYRDGLGLTTKGIVGTEFEHGSAGSLMLHIGPADSPMRRSARAALQRWHC